MSQTNLMFPDIVGQTECLNKLGFFVKGYEKTCVFPNLLITGSRGFGKSQIAQAIGRNLFQKDNPELPKRFIEVTGAEFQGNKALELFVGSVVDNYIGNGMEVTFFFDEIHLAAPPVLNWLLHVVNPTRNNITHNTYRDQEYEFDFTKLTFLCATTDPQRLSKPLLSRMERIDLAPYKVQDVILLINKYAPDVIFKDGVETNIANVMRGSPREVVQFCTRKLTNYLAQKGNNEFNSEDWQKLKRILAIKPLGLHNNEIEVLKYVNSKNGATLTEIAASLGLAANAVRLDCESFLLAQRLIRIDTKRYITPRGQELLSLLDRESKN